MKAVADGGASDVSNKKTLVVGCTQDLTITDHADFITLLEGIDPKNPLNKVYEIKQPSTSLAYCPVLKHTIIE